MAATKPKIIVVVGPTASGKTSLAIDIAKKFRGEIISADSRQIYRGLDIGTAKATAAEMQGVPHHLIDIADIDTVYTATDFKRDAEAAIENIVASEKLPIVAGGTFFYIDTLLERFELPTVSPNPDLRKRLEDKTAKELFTELKKKDSRRASDIDAKNKRRLIRALEIVETLGAVPEHAPAENPYNYLMLGIQTDKDDLRKRLRERGRACLQKGFLEEIEGITNKGISTERLKEIGFEYQIGLDLYHKLIDEAEFLERFEQKNWQYAKRQLTWLKRDASINWVTPADKSEVDLLVSNFLMQG